MNPSLQNTTDAALANERQEMAEKLAARDDALRDCFRRLDRWEPEPCNLFGCPNHVPNPAQVQMFRALGAKWDEAAGFAWQQGWCSAECAATADGIAAAAEVAEQQVKRREALVVLRGGVTT